MSNEIKACPKCPDCGPGGIFLVDMDDEDNRDEVESVTQVIVKEGYEWHYVFTTKEGRFTMWEETKLVCKHCGGELMDEEVFYGMIQDNIEQAREDGILTRTDGWFRNERGAKT